jgi:hypothetical protein
MAKENSKRPPSKSKYKLEKIAIVFISEKLK